MQFFLYIYFKKLAFWSNISFILRDLQLIYPPCVLCRVSSENNNGILKLRNHWGKQYWSVQLHCIASLSIGLLFFTEYEPFLQKVSLFDTHSTHTYESRLLILYCAAFLCVVIPLTEPSDELYSRSNKLPYQANFT